MAVTGVSVEHNIAVAKAFLKEHGFVVLKEKSYREGQTRQRPPTVATAEGLGPARRATLGPAEKDRRWRDAWGGIWEFCDSADRPHSGMGWGFRKPNSEFLVWHHRGDVLPEVSADNWGPFTEIVDQPAECRNGK